MGAIVESAPSVSMLAAIAAERAKLEEAQHHLVGYVTATDVLTAECDYLREQLAQAQRDAQRLDWIECRAMNGQIQIARSIMGTGYEIAVLDRAAPTDVAVRTGTLRQVIDAAIAAIAAKGEGE